MYLKCVQQQRLVSLNLYNSITIPKINRKINFGKQLSKQHMTLATSISTIIQHKVFVGLNLELLATMGLTGRYPKEIHYKKHISQRTLGQPGTISLIQCSKQDCSQVKMYLRNLQQTHSTQHKKIK